MSLRLESPAFEEGYPLPSRYTCDGLNVSPPLAWYNTPVDTRSVAVVIEDADSSPHPQTHWIIYNIPRGCGQLRERVPVGAHIEKGVRQAMNDFGRNGYSGPCPTSAAHRYFLHVYALDTLIELAPDAERNDFSRAIVGHVVGHGMLSFTYCRSRARHVHTESAPHF